MFGDVENVEIVNDKPNSTINAKKMDVTHEAYVIFVHSSDAYKALKSNIWPTNISNLVPADTWHQPDFKDNDHKPIRGIIECNHRCGMDAITVAVNDLSIDSEKSTCEHTATQFVMDLKRGAKLRDIRKILRSVRSSTDHLTLRVHNGFEDDALEDCIDLGSFQKRVLEIIGLNGAGPKLNELTIEGIGSISHAMLECIAPLLKPLETLNIDCIFCNCLYILPKFCPNVVDMNLSGQFWKGDGGDTVLQTWPSLESLTIRADLCDVVGDSDSETRLRRFIAINQQLETLELGIVTDNALLKAVAKNIRNLKNLTIKRVSFDGSGGMIDSLVRLKHLASIFVPTIIFKTSDFKTLLSCVECFSKMKRLKMSTLLQNYVLNEDDSLASVDDFPIQFHDDCSCHGPNSRAFTFNDKNKGVDLPKKKAILAIMVGVSPHLKANDKTLESRILNMFKGTTKFYPNVLKSCVIEEPDRLIYTHISCGH